MHPREPLGAQCLINPCLGDGLVSTWQGWQCPLGPQVSPGTLSGQFYFHLSLLCLAGFSMSAERELLLGGYGWSSEQAPGMALGVLSLAWHRFVKVIWMCLNRVKPGCVFCLTGLACTAACLSGHWRNRASGQRGEGLPASVRVTVQIWLLFCSVFISIEQVSCMGPFCSNRQ